MAQKIILSDAQCKDMLRTITALNGSLKASARALGFSWRAFYIRATRVKERFPAEYEAATNTREAQAPLSLSDHVAHHQAKKSAANDTARLKEALARIAELQAEIEKYEWTAKGSFSPAEWTLPSHTSKKREHMPYLLTSDAQLGEVVNAEETETGYGYSTEIYRQRHRKLIDTTIYLSSQHGGQAWTYPGIIYARGGDTLSGGIHDELRETDDLTPIEACKVAFEEESAGIDKLAEHFGRVDVKTPGAAGNHDRDTLKPRSKKAEAHSYDSLISYMLRNHFRNDKRVTFQTSKSFDLRFPIYDLNVLLTHGDRMGSKGGTGFIGPLATIMRGAQKVMMEQAALGFTIHRIDHGHFHTSAYLRWILSNGSYPGYSEFAKGFRMRPEPPIQMLLYHHPKHGVVDVKPINLLEK